MFKNQISIYLRTNYKYKLLLYLRFLYSQACIPADVVKASRVLFNQLKEELVQRAVWKGCGAEVEDKIPLASAKTLLYRLSDLVSLKTALDNFAW
jgi:hypothetical protein